MSRKKQTTESESLGKKQNTFSLTQSQPLTQRSLEKNRWKDQRAELSTY